MAVAELSPAWVERLLAEHGADPMVRDATGAWPSQVAKALAKYAEQSDRHEDVLVFQQCYDILVQAMPIEHGGGRDTSPQYVFEQAGRLLRARRYDEALAGFRRAAKEGHPVPARCWNGAGMACAVLGRDELALKYYGVWSGNRLWVATP